MKLTYKTCWDCSKIQEDELIKYMNNTQNPLIYEFINKMFCDMYMQYWECYTCPPFTIEMYCKASLTNYFGKKPPKPNTRFGEYWSIADREYKDQLKKFLKSASKGILEPIREQFNIYTFDNIQC